VKIERVRQRQAGSMGGLHWRGKNGWPLHPWLNCSSCEVRPQTLLDFSMPVPWGFAQVVESIVAYTPQAIRQQGFSPLGEKALTMNVPIYSPPMGRHLVVVEGLECDNDSLGCAVRNLLVGSPMSEWPNLNRRTKSDSRVCLLV